MKKIKKILFLLLAITFIISITGCGNKHEKEKTLKLGFVPLKNNEKLVEDTEPIAKKLSEKLGRKVEIFTASSYIGVVEGLNSGSVDFAFIPPFSSLLATNKGTAKNILTAKGKTGVPGYKSVILVKKSSNINNIADLKGKTLGFVDESSTSGYIYPASMIKNKGIDLDKDVKILFTGGHDKSVQLLELGDVDAIGTFEGVLDKYSKDFPNIKDDLKVIATSDLIPGVTVTVSNSLDNETQKKIKETLTSMQDDKEIMDLFTKLFSITGFEEVNEQSYNNVIEVAKTMNVDLEKVK